MVHLYEGDKQLFTYFSLSDDGCFSYDQIDMVVRHLEARGEEVLVLMPTKYTDKVVLITTHMKRHTPHATRHTHTLHVMCHTADRAPTTKLVLRLTVS